jgi:hypothetical protein
VPEEFINFNVWITNIQIHIYIDLREDLGEFDFKELFDSCNIYDHIYNHFLHIYFRSRIAIVFLYFFNIFISCVFIFPDSYFFPMFLLFSMFLIFPKFFFLPYITWPLFYISFFINPDFRQFQAFSLSGHLYPLTKIKIYTKFGCLAIIFYPV